MLYNTNLDPTDGSDFRPKSRYVLLHLSFSFYSFPGYSLSLYLIQAIIQPHSKYLTFVYCRKGPSKYTWRLLFCNCVHETDLFSRNFIFHWATQAIIKKILSITLLAYDIDGNALKFSYSVADPFLWIVNWSSPICWPLSSLPYGITYMTLIAPSPATFNNTARISSGPGDYIFLVPVHTILIGHLGYQYLTYPHYLFLHYRISLSHLHVCLIWILTNQAYFWNTVV